MLLVSTKGCRLFPMLSLQLLIMSFMQALDKAALKPGQRLLVQAGSGGVGMWVVQLAKQRSLHVTATCSTPNVGFVKVPPQTSFGSCNLSLS